MKKLCCLVLFLSLIFPLPIAMAEEVDLTPTAQAAYLIDYETGTVLYQKDAENKHYPASMTKMMSLLLVIEQLNSGALRWEDEVMASAHAAQMGGSQIYLEQGEVMTVEELVKSSALASANDAITALAEKVGGTEENFVAMMNRRAAELGCINTHFVNPTGLHDENHYSCAKDMALIAQTLIQVGGDKILQYTSKYEDYIRENSENKFWLVNTNKMIRTYQGMDGLKTGYTSQSLYCITVTAVRNDLRLIAVVMNEPTKDSRTKDAAALLDYGFASYRMVTDLEAGTLVTEIPIEKGKPERVALKTVEAVRHLSKVNEEVTIVDKTYTITENKAPLHVGDRIGSVTLHYSDGYTKTVDLTVKEPVVSLDFIDIFLMTLKTCVFS